MPHSLDHHDDMTAEEALAIDLEMYVELEQLEADKE